MKKNLTSAFSFLFVLFIFSGCHSGKKFNYASAYKFRVAEPVERKENKQEDLPSDVLPEDPHVDIYQLSADSKTIPVTNNYNIIKIKKSEPTRPELAGNSKIEKKEFKKVYKAVVKDIRENKKLNQAGARQMDYMTKGLILTISGLVLIIAGIALIGPIGLILGSIIAGIGLIVFLIGLLGLVL